MSDRNAAALSPELIARAAAGDELAFEQLFKIMHPQLVAFGTRYVRDRARAEELVQDLFFDLWNSRGSWTIRTSLRSYLFGALRNRAFNLQRRDAVEQDWSRDEAQPAVRALHQAPARADDLFEAAEQRTALADAFAKLPERCQLAMHLRWRDELSYAEIADALGISIKGVENQLGRGLKAIRAQLVGA